MRAEENYTDEPILMEEINIDSLEMPVAPDLEIQIWRYRIWTLRIWGCQI